MPPASPRSHRRRRFSHPSARSPRRKTTQSSAKISALLRCTRSAACCAINRGRIPRHSGLGGSLLSLSFVLSLAKGASRDRSGLPRDYSLSGTVARHAERCQRARKRPDAVLAIATLVPRNADGIVSERQWVPTHVGESQALMSQHGPRMFSTASRALFRPFSFSLCFSLPRRARRGPLILAHERQRNAIRRVPATRLQQYAAAKTLSSSRAPAARLTRLGIVRRHPALASVGILSLAARRAYSR